MCTCCAGVVGGVCLECVMMGPFCWNDGRRKRWMTMVAKHYVLQHRYGDVDVGHLCMILSMSVYDDL